MSQGDNAHGRLEDAADELRSLARLDDEYVPAHRIVRALGGELDARAQGGCRGHIQTAPLRMRCASGLSELEQTRTVTHELGHLAATVAGRERSEPEADRLGGAVLLPRGTINRIAQWCGCNIIRIVRTLPNVPASVWMPRFCMERGCVMIHRNASGRRVYAGPGLEHLVTRARPWELDLVRIAEAAWLRNADGRDCHRDLFGVTAWVLGRERPWSVIVMPPDAIDLLAGRGALDAPANGCDPAMAWWHAARVG